MTGCLVMTGSQRPTTWTFQTKRRRIDVALRPHMAVNSFAVLAQLAAAGIGLARLPQLYAASTEGLTEVLADYAPPGKATFVVYPGTRHVSPALRAMIEVVVASFAPCAGPAP